MNEILSTIQCKQLQLVVVDSMLFGEVRLAIFCRVLSKYFSGKTVSATYKTRKLSYHKDDRTMHLHMGSLKILESLSTPTSTFHEVFNGLIGGRPTQKILQSLNTPMLPFLPNF